MAGKDGPAVNVESFSAMPVPLKIIWTFAPSPSPSDRAFTGMERTNDNDHRVERINVSMSIDVSEPKGWSNTKRGYGQMNGTSFKNSHQCFFWIQTIHIFKIWLPLDHKQKLLFVISLLCSPSEPCGRRSDKKGGRDASHPNSWARTNSCGKTMP